MSDTVRVYCHLNGGIFHPADDQPTAIDFRYGEIVATAELPARRLMLVDRPLVVEFGMANPRLVVVRNRAGADLETYPDEATSERLARSVLRAGVFGTTRPADVTAAELGIRLPAARPGKMPGGANAFWLAPGAQLWLAPEDPQTPVPAMLLVCPGPEWRVA